MADLKKPPLPYVGVTGFTTPDEVHLLLMNLADRYQSYLECKMPLMVGVLVSTETLSGALSIETRPRRFPSMEQAKAIFEQASNQGDRMTLRLAHYCSMTPETLGCQLERLADLMGREMEGVQLNMAWPPPTQLESTHPRFRRTVLRIGKWAMTACRGGQDEIVARISEYGDLITDVLVDPSDGKSELADFNSMVPLLRAITERYPALGVGVAGGLEEQSVHSLMPLFREFPNLSIDAKGRLRTPDNADLDRWKTYYYVAQTLKVAQDSRRTA